MTERLRALPEEVAGEADVPLRLPDASAHHLRVLRVPLGARVVLFDGAGRERDAELTHYDRVSVTLTLRGEARDGVRRDGAAVTWLQAYPKGDKLETILRQATELGVARVGAVYTARSVPRDRGDRGGERVQRWQRIVEEAARQSGRADVPEVLAPAPLDEALAALAPGSLRLVAWERATLPLPEAARASGDAACVVLAGPEGGLDEAEVRRCEAAGFVAVSLGPRVLRAETVAPAVLAVLSALRGDLAASRAAT